MEESAPSPRVDHYCVVYTDPFVLLSPSPCVSRSGHPSHPHLSPSHGLKVSRCMTSEWESASWTKLERPFAIFSFGRGAMATLGLESRTKRVWPFLASNRELGVFPPAQNSQRSSLTFASWTRRLSHSRTRRSKKTKQIAPKPDLRFSPQPFDLCLERHRQGLWYRTIRKVSARCVYVF